MAGRTASRRGNFGFRTVVSPFQPRPADMMPDATYFGLVLLGSYHYSTFWDDEGNLVAPMRKFHTEMSSGLSLQTNAGRDHLAIDFDALARSQRGVGVRWALEGDDLTIRASRTPFSEPIDVRITERAVAWSEGDLLSLEGELLGDGIQWYAPMRDEGGGTYYATQVYRARGLVQGRPVDGFMGIDSLYGPPGQVFQTGWLFNGVEMAWGYFANVYDGGAFECGHLAFGADHWGFAAVQDHEGEVVFVADVDCDIELGPTKYVERATYRVRDEQWVFDAVERGEMRDLARQRDDKYHASAGVVRRVGDTREPRLSMAWLETFPLNGITR